ncbi:UPF0755 protein [Polynucleobacter meluiroseus]|uniref:Endolytic murein transglycosylase n=1 Tax=Polynucleobacter meluiroseus TaxID=1938814 RepID=A0A240DZG0_9BURK|nr:endolytic transglycosylase MltG [Polynucleobacter meluiroseus]SNX28565.1 UPF0755 protein [Polynucleobacter meluiroseus]
MNRNFQKNPLFFKKTGATPLWLYLLLPLICVGMLYAGILYWPVTPSNPNNGNDSSFKVKVNPQSGTASIGQQLADQGVRTSATAFQIAAYALFVGSKLKPGTYLLPLGSSTGNILLQMARGERVKESLTIIPGMTIWQVRALVDAHPALVHLTKNMNSQNFVDSLKLDYPSAEGLFFPDTYTFDPDDSDLAIYRRAVVAMQKQLDSVWLKKDLPSPYRNPYQLLTLASIIEKETGRSVDRNLVAAVFVNRLNKNMLLQTDPTIIYGLGPQFNGNLKKADLRRNSPYNTYMLKGLPPTPIAMPSRESLLAAAHPEHSQALFFVAKGDGSSHFSSTLREHESAVDLYQRKLAPKKQ